MYSDYFNSKLTFNDCTERRNDEKGSRRRVKWRKEIYSNFLVEMNILSWVCITMMVRPFHRITSHNFTENSSQQRSRVISYVLFRPPSSLERVKFKMINFKISGVYRLSHGFLASHMFFPTKIVLCSVCEKKKSQEENFAVVQVNVNWDWEDEEMMTDDSNVPTIYSCCVSLFYAVQVCNLHKGWDRDDIERDPFHWQHQLSAAVSCGMHKGRSRNTKQPPQQSTHRVKWKGRNNVIKVNVSVSWLLLSNSKHP